MAIKLPNQKLNESFEAILLFDDALDVDSETFGDDFQRFNDGTGPAPIKEGCVPAVWTLKPLPNRLLQRLKGELGDGQDAFFYAVGLYSIKSVSGLDVDLAFGQDRKGYEHLDTESEQILGIRVITELGQRVFSRIAPNLI